MKIKLLILRFFALTLILASLYSCSSKQTVKITTPNIKGAAIYVNGVNTGKITPSSIKINKKASYQGEKKTQVYVLKKEGYLDYTYKDKASGLSSKYKSGIYAYLEKEADPKADLLPEPEIKSIEKENWLTYKNDIYSIKYPSTWIPSTENEYQRFSLIANSKDKDSLLFVNLLPINKTMYGGNYSSYFINLIKKIEKEPSNQIVKQQSTIVNGNFSYVDKDNIRVNLFSKKNQDVAVNCIATSEQQYYAPYADTIAAIMNSLSVHATEVETEKIKATNYKKVLEPETISNLREDEKADIGLRYSINSTDIKEPVAIINKPKTDATNKPEKLKKVTQDFPNLKYRRSSLYTLMINDLTRDYETVIVNAFGNNEMPEKFNEHNIGPYLITGHGYKKDQVPTIKAYIEKNDVAKKMIAKWFNRTEDGAFDMNLIAERGQYNASALDINIANSTARGTALLSDAGEELIGNSFLIVNNYKYTSKEKVAETAGKVLQIAGALTGQDDLADLTSSAIKSVGKGYIIKSTSYLYRLEWNDSIAAVFYNDYWTDKSNLDPQRVQAFNNSDIFKLKLVGKQNAIVDVQSTTYANKTNEELIRKATVKATDKSIAKLQKAYPEFQTKTPLTSVEPLAAKIGLKEGLEAKDKFEVLEQVIDKNGLTKYVRKGVITVDKSQIWDNSDSEVKDGDVDRTLFKGNATGLYPGMLIKQIR